MSMFLEKVKSEGLSHLSYIFGHQGVAAVVDPRRDVAVYERIAADNGCRIACVFETHRNEDYVAGSTELALRTGARVLHGAALPFAYGEPAREGDAFEVGGLTVRVLETPGHTFESLSYVLEDTTNGGEPAAVFTGDALFIGDVGRTDFFPDRRDEVAGLLYDSIFQKLLPLGDQVILLPAHGAGSVCGNAMAEREFSTLGLERRANPLLQLDRDTFIRRKRDEWHYIPPYFRHMEFCNLHGDCDPLGCPAPPAPLDPAAFARAAEEGALVLDLRSPEAVSGATVPGALAIPLHMVPGFAGYFLPVDATLLLLAENLEEAETARTYLLRIGYDNVAGYLKGGMTAWETSGRPYDRIPAVHVDELVRRIEEKAPFTLLDVRKPGEVARGMLPGARHIFLGDLPERLDEIPRDRPVTTFCGSGQRAVIAASILRRAGFPLVEDALGSMAACKARGCPIVQPGQEG